MDESTQMDEQKQKLRIEALRGAAQIVAGAFAGGHSRLVKPEDTAAATTDIAELFTRWLERGEQQ